MDGWIDADYSTLHWATHLCHWVRHPCCSCSSGASSSPLSILLSSWALSSPGGATAVAADDDDDDDDQSDVAPGRATGTIDPETGLEIVVPSFDAPLDKKGRPLLACTWPPCARYARPNSKYCSRNCSNKNARARYARRKDG